MTDSETPERLAFFLAMNPPTATHQEKAVRVVGGRPVFYEPAPLRAARSMLTAYLARFRPPAPLTGALRLRTLWCFPLDRGGRHRDGEYKTSRPDTDNLQKLLKDCMTECGFWKDDAQVASELVEKFWAETPGIYIALEALNPGRTPGMPLTPRRMPQNRRTGAGK